ncbi:MAG: hypothetical protein BWY09_01887 [Candidatus Hydrogenedentes bacterium ADurb.Bin179]|nr:MAG: hypothetical protein BWY09_01887 [Candidatus Hydrogenedentes bacterium ADurb.Bin179]
MGVHAGIRFLPGFPIEQLPFPLEGLTPSGLRPIFRFLQENGLGAQVHRGLYDFFDVLYVGVTGDVVPDGRTVSVHIEFAGFGGLHLLFFEAVRRLVIVVIAAPGDAGHHADGVALFTPLGNAFRESGIDAVDDGHIGANIQLRGIVSRLLKTGVIRAGRCREGDAT